MVLLPHDAIPKEGSVERHMGLDLECLLYVDLVPHLFLFPNPLFIEMAYRKSSGLRVYF